MANEVDFSGWIRSKEHLEWIKKSPKYRITVHWQRFTKALKYRRWSYFTWFNIRGLLLNETTQF